MRLIFAIKRYTIFLEYLAFGRFINRSLFQDLMAQIREIKGRTETTQNKHNKARRTIFEELVDSKELPKQEKSVDRLWQEGQIVIGAGTETTAWSA